MDFTAEGVEMESIYNMAPVKFVDPTIAGCDNYEVYSEKGKVGSFIISFPFFLWLFSFLLQGFHCDNKGWLLSITY